eukprot:TRINITY_DN4968_c0_g1_i13.p1 TRINITY_DN4968_c0_g1~~TRINITY_DN4968_c0_g1_i13.p1  ORF type:complete len:407 (-),score=50.70 TRINITY_DN4968_c0_g1_i13:42-1262(-)
MIRDKLVSKICGGGGHQPSTPLQPHAATRSATLPPTLPKCRADAALAEGSSSDDDPSTSAPFYGRKVNKADFEIQRVLGEGAHAKVFQVVRKDDNRTLAMKVMLKQDIINLGQVKHAMAERQILEDISNPFFVNLHHAFQSRSKLYMILDYCPGGELFFHMRNEGRFSVERTRLYVAEIAIGLDHMHRMEIVYRDLKPENLLLDEQGHIRLTDFGLCKQGLSRSSSVCGTPEYMAPEVIEVSSKTSSIQYGAAVDWWALGTLLYEMLAGRPPFYSSTRHVMFQRILNAPLPKHACVPVDAFHLCGRLLVRNPQRRLGAVLDDFQKLQQHGFFGALDWEAVSKRQVTPCMIPNKAESYVDSQFSSQPIGIHCRESFGLSPMNDNTFNGFTFEEKHDVGAEIQGQKII